ncbi:MAG: aminopeptidase [Bdellovibrionales bacterium]|nr:aminopeptidase [Bdellovibrionales bacterium]
MKRMIYGSLVFLLLTGCSTNFRYLQHVSYHQMGLLIKRTSIKKALEKYSFNEEQKKKLQLVSEIKTFTREKLKLNIDRGLYSSYVHLERPYVSYLLRVSPVYELTAYKWDFPIVGSMPYKGFFDKDKTKKAAASFPEEEYDVSIRGVRAYSTLGWFNDPVLSTMLFYKETDFVVMVFHELMHTVLFFKNHVDFNERFAEFVGRQAALLFYTNKEGPESETVQKMLLEWEDELLFSSFMVSEYEMLDKWYKEHKGEINRERKQNRLQEIQERFRVEIQVNLKTNRYYYFSNQELNNAQLLSYRSYNYNMAEFEKLFDSSLVNRDIKAFVEYCAQFKKEKDPEAAISQAIVNLE